MESLLCGVVQGCLLTAVLDVGFSYMYMYIRGLSDWTTFYRCCVVHAHGLPVVLDLPPCASSALITSGFSHTVAQCSGVRLVSVIIDFKSAIISSTYPLISISFTEVGLTALIKLTALAQPYWFEKQDAIFNLY